MNTSQEVLCVKLHHYLYIEGFEGPLKYYLYTQGFEAPLTIITYTSRGSRPNLLGVEGINYLSDHCGPG